MNYFEIFNKVLLELNYRAIQTFENIYKSEHKKILEAINRVNNEVLASYEWPFLERTTLLDVIEGENIYTLPFSGPIKCVYSADASYESYLEDSNRKNPVWKRVLYTPHTEELLYSRLLGEYYAVAAGNSRGAGGGKIIFQKPACDKVYSITYYSRNFALGENGDFKEKLTAEEDVSILPMPFAEHILVYGTCLKIKANPSYPKFAFWNTMYIQALANLRQKSPQTKECEPFIKLI